jgi:hypothetical protein
MTASIVEEFANNNTLFMGNNDITAMRLSLARAFYEMCQITVN